MASTPSRGRGTDKEQPIALCEDDRRKLWGLLDADVPARLRRLELLGAALLAVSAGPRVAELAQQSPAAWLIGWLL